MLPHDERAKYAEAWRLRAHDDHRRRRQLRREALLRAQKAAEVIKAKYRVKKVYLFGSTARGDFWDHSDIDIAIEGLPDPGKYLSVFGDIWDIVYPYKVDLVCLEEVSARVKERVLSEGILL
ncbi:MAG: nucleotidyltransferase domain-containing protein [Peptococcaceae bacterium]|nr:nucleotidyltransferase domain-containing protein [Peptococcaceae bacterium]